MKRTFWICMIVTACGSRAEEANAPGVDIRGGGAIDAPSEAQVRALMTQGITRQAAIDMLTNEALLLRQAQRLGLERHDEVTAATNREAVRVLLERLERETTVESISRERVAQKYEAQKGRFVHPELRLSKHLLVSLDKDVQGEQSDKARVFIESALRALLASSDVDKTLQELAAQDPPGMNVMTEIVPAMGRDSNADPAYMDLVFSMAAPGVAPRAVRSSFGWHAIVLTEIRPPANTSLDHAEATLRAELLPEERKRVMDELLSDLRASSVVQIDPAAVELINKLDFETLEAEPPTP